MASEYEWYIVSIGDTYVFDWYAATHFAGDEGAGCETGKAFNEGLAISVGSYYVLLRDVLQ